MRLARPLHERLPRGTPAPGRPPHVLTRPLGHHHNLRRRVAVLCPRRRHVRRVLRRRPSCHRSRRRPSHSLRPQLPRSRPCHRCALPLCLRGHNHRRRSLDPNRRSQSPIVPKHRPSWHNPIRLSHPIRQARTGTPRIYSPDSPIETLIRRRSSGLHRPQNLILLNRNRYRLRRRWKIPSGGDNDRESRN